MWPKLKRTWCSVAYKGITHDSFVSSHQSAIHWFVFSFETQAECPSVFSGILLEQCVIRHGFNSCNHPIPLWSTLQSTYCFSFVLLSPLKELFVWFWLKMFRRIHVHVHVIHVFLCLLLFFFPPPFLVEPVWYGTFKAIQILEFSSCCAGICSLCSLMPSMLQHGINGGSVFCRCSFYCFVQKSKAEGVKGMLQFLTVCGGREKKAIYLFPSYFLILIIS